jgi:hypothetical protein
MLSVLEGAIKRDYLSSNFETTTELLNSKTQDTTQNSVGGSASATVLPWVPDTTAAVAIVRLGYFHLIHTSSKVGFK